MNVEIRVIYGDTDQMGVVYYANYLRFFETARNEFLRAKGARYRDVEEELGVRLPVVDVGVQYKAPARYDDLITVQIALAKLGRASVRFEYRVVRGLELLVSGHTVHACIDHQGKVTPLPEALSEKVSA